MSELLRECRGYIANYLEGIEGATECVKRIDAALAAPEATTEPVAWMMPDGEIIQANKDTRGMWRIGGKPLYAEAVREALNEALQHCEFRKDAGQDSAVLSGMVLQIERCINRALDLTKL